MKFKRVVRQLTRKAMYLTIPKLIERDLELKKGDEVICEITIPEKEVKKDENNNKSD